MNRPTVGRALHYWPEAYQRTVAGNQPFAALVVYVHSDEYVNIVYFGADGSQYRRLNVHLPTSRGALPGECSWPALPAPTFLTKESA